MWLVVPTLPEDSESPASAPGSEDSTSASNWLCPVVTLWSLLSGKPTPLPSSDPAWHGREWVRLLSGTTLPPSTAQRGVDAWISRWRATHASQNPSPASDEATPTSAGFGEPSGDAFATWDVATSSWRTSLATSRARSTKSSPTFPRAGGLRSGTVSRRTPSAPLTRGTASSALLPTPNAVPYGSSQNGVNGKGGEHERPSAGTPSLWTMAAREELRLPTPTATDCKASGVAGNWTPESGRNSGATLTDVVVRGLATPTASDCKRAMASASQKGRNLSGDLGNLPTPNARDMKGRPGAGTIERGGRQASLPAAACPTGSEYSRLSPRFVEWMMGLPIGWTEIGPSDSSASATASSRKPRTAPSRRSGDDSTAEPSKQGLLF